MGAADERPDPGPAIVLPVHCEFDVAAVVAGAQRFCGRHRLGTVFAAHVATAASELANNLWMHASRGGRIRLAWVGDGERHGVELVAEDDGPGIADLALALTEGWSSAGGMGCGLPGVKRLMDDFEIESRPGRGTRIVAVKWLIPAPAGRVRRAG